MGGLQGSVHDIGQVVADRAQVHGVLQACRERGHVLFGVIPGPVEPPVDQPLDAPRVLAGSPQEVPVPADEPLVAS